MRLLAGVRARCPMSNDGDDSDNSGRKDDDGTAEAEGDSGASAQPPNGRRRCGHVGVLSSDHVRGRATRDRLGYSLVWAVVAGRVKLAADALEDS